jgi:hypothetical protein
VASVSFDDVAKVYPDGTRAVSGFDPQSVMCPASAGRSSNGVAISVPRMYALVWPAYGAVVLAMDTRVGIGGERILGAVTWLALFAALRPLPRLARAQAIGVVLFATVAEVTGSILWGVYHYRLHNLPLFVPPGHGLVYLSGLALARILGERPAVLAAAVGSLGWDSPVSPHQRSPTSQARSASRCSASSSGARARARRTPASSSSLRRSSGTAPRSGSGAGLAPCPASESGTATRRAAPPAVTSGST